MSTGEGSGVVATHSALARVAAPAALEALLFREAPTRAAISNAATRVDAAHAIELLLTHVWRLREERQLAARRRQSERRTSGIDLTRESVRNGVTLYAVPTDDDSDEDEDEGDAVSEVPFSYIRGGKRRQQDEPAARGDAASRPVSPTTQPQARPQPQSRSPDRSRRPAVRSSPARPRPVSPPQLARWLRAGGTGSIVAGSDANSDDDFESPPPTRGAATARPVAAGEQQQDNPRGGSNWLFGVGRSLFGRWTGSSSARRPGLPQGRVARRAGPGAAAAVSALATVSSGPVVPAMPDVEFVTRVGLVAAYPRECGYSRPYGEGATVLDDLHIALVLDALVQQQSLALVPLYAGHDLKRSHDGLWRYDADTRARVVRAWFEGIHTDRTGSAASAQAEELMDRLDAVIGAPESHRRLGMGGVAWATVARLLHPLTRSALLEVTYARPADVDPLPQLDPRTTAAEAMLLFFSASVLASGGLGYRCAAILTREPSRPLAPTATGYDTNGMPTVGQGESNALDYAAFAVCRRAPAADAARLRPLRHIWLVWRQVGNIPGTATAAYYVARVTPRHVPIMHDPERFYRLGHTDPEYVDDIHGARMLWMDLRALLSVFSLPRETMQRCEHAQAIGWWSLDWLMTGVIESQRRTVTVDTGDGQRCIAHVAQVAQSDQRGGGDGSVLGTRSALFAGLQGWGVRRFRDVVRERGATVLVHPNAHDAWTAPADPPVVMQASADPSSYERERDTRRADAVTAGEQQSARSAQPSDENEPERNVTPPTPAPTVVRRAHSPPPQQQHAHEPRRDTASERARTPSDSDSSSSSSSDSHSSGRKHRRERRRDRSASASSDSSASDRSSPSRRRTPAPPPAPLPPPPRSDSGSSLSDSESLSSDLSSSSSGDEENRSPRGRHQRNWFQKEPHVSRMAKHVSAIDAYFAGIRRSARLKRSSDTIDYYIEHRDEMRETIHSARSKHVQMLARARAVLRTLSTTTLHDTNELLKELQDYLLGCVRSRIYTLVYVDQIDTLCRTATDLRMQIKGIDVITQVRKDLVDHAEVARRAVKKLLSAWIQLRMARDDIIPMQSGPDEGGNGDTHVLADELNMYQNVVDAYTGRHPSDPNA